MESEHSFSKISNELNELLKKLKAITINRNNGTEANDSTTMVIHILSLIASNDKNANEWDHNTSYCRKFHWNELMRALKKSEDVENLLAKLYPFITEYVLSKDLEFDDYAHISMEYIEKHINSLPNETKESLESTKRNLIFNIYRERFNDESVAVTRQFISSSRDVNAFNEKWKDCFDEKEKKIAGLESRLTKIREKYNFIGLKNGFSEIKRTKKIEKWLSFFLMFIFFILIIAPIIYETTRLQELTLKKEFSFLNLVPLIPIMSLDFLLIYFFRIVHHNYQSAKDQLVQIDLRVTMCAFIDGYVDFKDRMIKDDKKISLDTFEKLMFSNIATTGKDIPSTYDGLESLAKIISAVRK